MKATLSTPGQEAALKNYLGLKKKKASGQGGHAKKGRSCFSVRGAQVNPSGRVQSSWTFTLPRGLCDREGRTAVITATGRENEVCACMDMNMSGVYVCISLCILQINVLVAFKSYILYKLVFIYG